MEHITQIAAFNEAKELNDFLAEEKHIAGIRVIRTFKELKIYGNSFILIYETNIFQINEAIRIEEEGKAQAEAQAEAEAESMSVEDIPF